MKRRIKVFESGNYGKKGEFSNEKVNDIFGNVKENVKAIFVHSSHWRAEGKTPVEIGEFSSFETKDEGGKKVAYAIVEFNKVGERYYDDGILKGVSAEIGTDGSLPCIAVLPIGQTPAVSGAEFEADQEAIILEFEEVKVGKEAIIAALSGLSLEDKIAVLKAITGSITDEEKKGMRTLVYNEFEEKKTPETEAQIEARIVARYEKKSNDDKAVSEFMAAHNLKITPGMKKAGFEEFAKELIKDDGVVEFSKEDKATKFEKLKTIMAAMPDAIKLDEFATDGKTESVMEKAYRETKERNQ